MGIKYNAIFNTNFLKLFTYSLLIKTALSISKVNDIELKYCNYL